MISHRTHAAEHTERPHMASIVPAPFRAGRGG